MGRKERKRLSGKTGRVDVKVEVGNTASAKGIGKGRETKQGGAWEIEQAVSRPFEVIESFGVEGKSGAPPP